MNKSKIRNKIIKIRKKKFDKSLQINLGKFISLLKIDKLNLKNIGGYYPSNYEKLIDQTANEISNFIEKVNLEKLS